MALCYPLERAASSQGRERDPAQSNCRGKRERLGDRQQASMGACGRQIDEAKERLPVRRESSEGLKDVREALRRQKLSPYDREEGDYQSRECGALVRVVRDAHQE